MESVETLQSLKYGDWLAVHYDEEWYIAVVEDTVQDGCVRVNFLHPKGPNTRFRWPIFEDTLWIDLRSILAKLIDSAIPVPSHRYFTISRNTCSEIDLRFRRNH